MGQRADCFETFIFVNDVLKASFMNATLKSVGSVASVSQWVSGSMGQWANGSVGSVGSLIHWPICPLALLLFYCHSRLQGITWSFACIKTSIEIRQCRALHCDSLLQRIALYASFYRGFHCDYLYRELHWYCLIPENYIAIPFLQRITL